MARRSIRRRFRRSFRRAKREYIWTTTFVAQDLNELTGMADGIAIVDRDDWCRDPAQVQNVEKGCVVKRIIGDVRFSTLNGSGARVPAGAVYQFGVGKFDEDDGTVLDLATNFFGEDWMHLEAGTLDPNNATTVAFAPQVSTRHHVDIGVARKLTSDEEIRFLFAGYEWDGTPGTAGDNLKVDYFFRTLLQLP